MVITKKNLNLRLSLTLSILHSLIKIIKESFPRKVTLPINRKDNLEMTTINKIKINHTIKMKVDLIEAEAEAEEVELKDSTMKMEIKIFKVILAIKEAEEEVVAEVEDLNMRMILNILKKERLKENNFQEMINQLDKFPLPTRKKHGAAKWITTKEKRIILKI